MKHPTCLFIQLDPDRERWFSVDEARRSCTVRVDAYAAKDPFHAQDGNHDQARGAVSRCDFDRGGKQRTKTVSSFLSRQGTRLMRGSRCKARQFPDVECTRHRETVHELGKNFAKQVGFRRRKQPGASAYHAVGAQGHRVDGILPIELVPFQPVIARNLPMQRLDENLVSVGRERTFKSRRELVDVAGDDRNHAAISRRGMAALKEKRRASITVKSYS